MSEIRSLFKYFLIMMLSVSISSLQAQTWDEIADGGGDAGNFPAGGYQGAGGAGTFTTITGNNADGIDAYGILITDAANFFIEDMGTLDTRGYLWNPDGTAFCTNDDSPADLSDFSFGMGDGVTHVAMGGTIVGMVGTVAIGEKYILSIGANVDDVFSPGDGDVFVPLPGGALFTELQGPTGNPFERYRAGGKGPYSISLSGCVLDPGPTVPGGEATGLIWDEETNGLGDSGQFPETLDGFQMADGSDCYTVITGSLDLNNNFDVIDAYAIEVTDAENFQIFDTGGDDTNSFFWFMDGTRFLSCDDNADPNTRFGFSSGFGDANTHPPFDPGTMMGGIQGDVGKVENGETYVLAIGGFGDEAQDSNAVSVFLEASNFEEAVGPNPNSGEFAFYLADGDPPRSYIYRLQGCVLAGSVGCEEGCGFALGDVNQDGEVDFLDIQPFVDVLNAMEFQCEADVNQDKVVDFLDIQPFVDLLS